MNPFLTLYAAGLILLRAEPAFMLQADAGILRSPAIAEASGLATSLAKPDFLWVVNDSGGSAELHLIAMDGTPRGSVSVDGATNRDWEDLASFKFSGRNHLVIADIGDNSASRESCTIYIVAEPELPVGRMGISGKVSIDWRIDFTYEDGPRDCEAVAVDAAGRKIILIDKRSAIPGVYELPLRPTGKAIARRIGSTETTAAGLAGSIAIANQPTGMDISADGTMAAVVTYHGAFLFTRRRGTSWADAFGRKPVPLSPHRLPQAESIAFTLDGKSIFCVSEKAGSRIARYLASP